MSFDGGFVGCFAVSKKGHDNGKVYIIKSVVDDKFVLVVDGENRPLERPKRKNIRHLDVCKHRTAATSDLAIKRAVKEFSKKESE